MKLAKILTLVCSVALVGVVTAPPALATDPVPVATSHASPVAVALDTESGQGILGCAACAFGAGIIVSGGPAAIAAFLATPGAEAALIVCAAACFDS